MLQQIKLTAVYFGAAIVFLLVVMALYRAGAG